MKARTLIFLLICGLFTQFATSQENEKPQKFLNKLSVGLGYNFFKVKPLQSLYNTDMNSSELSLKFEINRRHLVYLNVPFYIKNYRDREPNIFDMLQRDYSHLFGIRAGYDFNIFLYQGLTVFVGIGVDYMKIKLKTHQDIFGGLEYEYTNFYYEPTEYFAVSPQAGAAYRWRFLELQLKYKQYLSKGKSRLEQTTDHPEHNGITWTNDDQFKTFNGLTLSLFYHF